MRDTTWDIASVQMQCKVILNIVHETAN